MKRMIIWAIALVLVSQFALADYFYTPMNFDSPSNHTFTISLDGFVNVTLPENFTLLNGNLSGQDNISFVIESPSLSSTDPHLFVGTIYLNNTVYDQYYLLSVPDNKIVDTKVEIGHGDFNYIDSNGYIGTDDTLLFNIVRVWAMGSDIIGDPATDVRFNCTYPMIIPNTVDSKYTTTYNTNNIIAEGELSRMEGISMFRVFVLSQEVDYPENTSYDVTCDKLYYSFPHTEVIADIQDITLEARSQDPLTISMANKTGYITYTITNSELYDLQNIEFLWSIGTHTIREEIDSLDSGESVQYNIQTNSSCTVTLKARFIPEWMFNSRSPTYYEQTQFDSYYAPEFFEGINTSEYYDNHIILTNNLFETQEMGFSIDILQNAPYGGNYMITYYFYNEQDELISSDMKQILGTGTHTINFADDNIEPNGYEEDFDVYAMVSVKDAEGDYYDFPVEKLGTITFSALTDNGPKGPGLYDVIVSSEYTRYDVEDTIKADITIINTGDTPDEDTVLIYWLEDAQGNRFGETKEQILEVPVGTTTLTRSISLPLNSAPGEWKFRVEYETVVQPTISVYDSIEVRELTLWDKINDRVKGFFSGNWALAGLIIGSLLLVLLIFLLIPKGKKSKWNNWKQEKRWDEWKKDEPKKEGWF